MIDIVGTSSQIFVAIATLITGILGGIFSCILQSIARNKSNIMTTFIDIIMIFCSLIIYLLTVLLVDYGQIKLYSLSIFIIAYIYTICVSCNIYKSKILPYLKKRKKKKIVKKS